MDLLFRPHRTGRAGAAFFLAAALACGTPTFAAEDDPIARLQSEYVRAVKPGEQAETHRELLAAVLRRVQRSHASDADFNALAAAASKVLAAVPAGTGEPAEVFRQATNAALRTLDNYSRYFDAQAHAQQRADATGRFVGLGIEVEAADGVVRIVAPMPGGPAERAGLRTGDLIVQVDGRSLQGVPLGDAITRMRGEAGTQVAIKVQRAGADPFDLSLTRDTIQRSLLRWRMEGDALVLRLSSFSGPVSDRLAEAVAAATAAHAPKGVVLDLRGNPGGLLREAIHVADAFLAQGEIASMRGRTPATQRTWEADAAQLLPGVPLVVLVDRRSASASELVAASLQAHGRATVIGQRSFGKGSVQTTYGLGEGLGAVKLTTALYYGPSGRHVNRQGVTPDVELLAAPPDNLLHPGAAASKPEAADAARMRVMQSRCGSHPSPTVAADAGLACALAYLQAGSDHAFAKAYAELAH
ncbi:S41 family peptidase [Caenimonas sedimenti]|nr:S41 family peptidase [Caenimonas sedimenti]